MWRNIFVALLRNFNLICNFAQFLWITDFLVLFNFDSIQLIVGCRLLVLGNLYLCDFWPIKRQTANCFMCSIKFCTIFFFSFCFDINASFSILPVSVTLSCNSINVLLMFLDSDGWVFIIYMILIINDKMKK